MYGYFKLSIVEITNDQKEVIRDVTINSDVRTKEGDARVILRSYEL